MIYLALQIFVCLILVLGIGFLMGWLLRSVGVARQFGEVESTWKMRIKQKDEMLAKMFAEMDEKEQELTSLIESAQGGTGDNMALTSKLQQTNRTLAEVELKLAETERELKQKTAANTKLEDAAKQASGSGELRSQLATLRGANTKKEAKIARLNSKVKSLETLVSNLKQEAAKKPQVAAPPQPEPPAPEPQVKHPEKDPLVQTDVIKPPNPLSETQGSAASQDAQRVDELRNIFGIGPVLEKRLNAEGITSFLQVASFTKEDINRVAEAIGCKADRIIADDWIGGARLEHFEKYGEEI